MIYKWTKVNEDEENHHWTHAHDSFHVNDVDNVTFCLNATIFSLSVSNLLNFPFFSLSIQLLINHQFDWKRTFLLMEKLMDHSKLLCWRTKSKNGIYSAKPNMTCLCLLFCRSLSLSYLRCLGCRANVLKCVSSFWSHKHNANL